MAITLLQEIGYLKSRLSLDLVRAAFGVLEPHEGDSIDKGVLDDIAEELKAALRRTIRDWDWVCLHQPHTLWFSPRTGERTRPRVEGKRLVDILAHSVVEKLLNVAAEALKASVAERRGLVDDAKQIAEEAVQQAVLSLGYWECKYNYVRRGCYLYDSDTGDWHGACSDCLGLEP